MYVGEQSGLLACAGAVEVTAGTTDAIRARESARVIRRRMDIAPVYESGTRL
jgi:hypothetical protein